MESDMASEPKPWTNEHARAIALRVALLKRVHVFPWGQFLFAEGTGAEVKAAFATHDVIVKGSGLTALLDDLALQRVSLLREPARADKFVAGGAGPRIVELSVRKAESGAS
jgi:hypothetical protein